MSRLPTPPLVLPDDEGMIADLWDQLRQAAAAGDNEARVFLEGTFEPWAREQMAKRSKS